MANLNTEQLLDPLRYSRGAAQDAHSAHRIRQTLENVVIPHLTSTGAHRGWAIPSWDETTGMLMPVCPIGLLEEQLPAFTDDILAEDMPACRARSQELLEKGVSYTDILLSFYAVAGHRIGELWREDLCSFTDVTLALGLLHQLTRELGQTDRHFGGSRLGRAGAVAPRQALPVGRALLLMAPGDQHSFGLQVLARLLRGHNWWVDTLVGEDALRPQDQLVTTSYEFVGVGVACDEFLPGLKDAIAMFRDLSRKRDVHVLLGGQCVSRYPDLSQVLHCDLALEDAREVLAVAKTLQSNLNLVPESV